MSFLWRGGMRADNVNQRVLVELMDFHPEIIFVGLGGNDISVNSSPRQTSEDIVKKATVFSDNGAKNVYISEIMTKGQFSKTPGLKKEIFEKKSNQQTLEKEIRTILCDIHFPEHYDENKVHLNAKRTVKVPGMKKFQCRLSRVLCRH